VATIPHGGRAIPDAFGEKLTVPIDTLWADWYTNDLYDFLSALGITSVRTQLSRFVADPNRDPDSGHGDFWRTVVPATDPMGEPIYGQPLLPIDVRRRVELAHRPFHEQLDAALAAAKGQHQRVLLLDLHSFGVPLDVDVVIGDAHGATASREAVERVERALRSVGFTTARNTRFPGGWIIRRFAHDDRVDAISIELNQRCYLAPTEVDAWPGVPRLLRATLAAAQHRLRRAFENLLGRRSERYEIVFRPPRPGDVALIAEFLEHDEVARWWPRYDVDAVARALRRTEAEGTPTWTIERQRQVLGFGHAHLESVPPKVDVMIGPLPDALDLRAHAIATIEGFLRS
jgi:N-formylglutamate amidohydrolase